MRTLHDTLNSAPTFPTVSPDENAMMTIGYYPVVDNVSCVIEWHWPHASTMPTPISHERAELAYNKSRGDIVAMFGELCWGGRKNRYVSEADAKKLYRDRFETVPF